MVECALAKVEVAGSNPVSRSSFFTTKDTKNHEGFLSLRASLGILYLVGVCRLLVTDHWPLVLGAVPKLSRLAGVSEF